MHKGGLKPIHFIFKWAVTLLTLLALQSTNKWRSYFFLKMNKSTWKVVSLRSLADNPNEHCSKMIWLSRKTIFHSNKECYRKCPAGDRSALWRCTLLSCHDLRIKSKIEMEFLLTILHWQNIQRLVSQQFVIWLCYFVTEFVILERLIKLWLNCTWYQTSAILWKT